MSLERPRKHFRVMKSSVKKVPLEKTPSFWRSWNSSVPG